MAGYRSDGVAEEGARALRCRDRLGGRNSLVAERRGTGDGGARAARLRLDMDVVGQEGGGGVVGSFGDGVGGDGGSGEGGMVGGE